MQNRIKDFIEEWNNIDDTLVNFSNGDKKAVQSRQYQKEKLRKTAAFIRSTGRLRLSKEEKAWLIVLKTANSHRERKLYPNRLIRYSRRALGSIGRAARQWRKQLAAENQPTAGFANSHQAQQMPVKIKPNKNDQIKDVVKATVLKLPAKNKYAAAKGAKQSKGRSL